MTRPRPPPLQLSWANPSDADAIATLHLQTFDSNPLLHAQFPTPASLASLHTVLSNEMRETIQAGEESGKVVLVVRDAWPGERVVSFAKWDLPGVDQPEVDGLAGGGGRQDVTWHEDCQLAFLDGYHELAEAAKKRVVGDAKCYRLTFVGTHSDFKGRGAATLLTEWGLSRARAENIPVYLESTIAASSLYYRLGFVVRDGLSMTLPGTNPDGSPITYEEIGMLRTWGPPGADN